MANEISPMTEVNATVVSNPVNGAMAAPMKGLTKFNQFNNGESVKEIITAIGADFEVEKQPLIRVTNEMLAAIRNGEPVQIAPNHIIGSHMATVHKQFDDTIGVVGADYGVVQNNNALEILDLLNGVDTQMRIVSAGMVGAYKPYFQIELPSAAIDGDNSETKFFAFAYTSHDGSSALKISVTPVRVVCANTFAANLHSKSGWYHKHTKFVGTRVDFSKDENVKRVQALARDLNIFREDFLAQMNSWRLSKVTDTQINEYVAKLFLDDKKMLEEAARVGYKLDSLELSTRTKNTIFDFKEVLESGVGQDNARGTKYWLWNAATNFWSNKKYTTPEKRFDSIMEGGAQKRVSRANDLLLAM